MAKSLAWLFIASLIAAVLVVSDVDVSGKLSCAAMAALLVFAAAQLRGDNRGAQIDCRVDNRIIATDGHGRYLVQARTSRQITGSRYYVDGNLPAHVIQRGRGRWFVNFGGWIREDDIEKIEWRPMPPGEWQVVPRGAEKRDALDDMMGGWTHDYIQERDV